jgi:hypothetical protein
VLDEDEPFVVLLTDDPTGGHVPQHVRIATDVVQRSPQRFRRRVDALPTGASNQVQTASPDAHRAGDERTRFERKELAW